MKIEDLPVLYPDNACLTIGEVNNRAHALAKRLQLAKELLSETDDNKRSLQDWDAERIAFIAKLDAEGL